MCAAGAPRRAGRGARWRGRGLRTVPTDGGGAATSFVAYPISIEFRRGKGRKEGSKRVAGTRRAAAIGIASSFRQGHLHTGELPDALLATCGGGGGPGSAVPADPGDPTHCA